MKAKISFIEYLRLLRPQGASATAATILIGSLIMGLRDLFLLFILFIIGILTHIFVFVLNDYADIKVDKEAKTLQKKPLVSGVIPKEHAIIIALFAGLFSYMLTIIYFQTIFPLIFLSLAFLFSSIYDLFGKRISGSDVFIAGACLFICLFGASTVSIQFTYLIFIVAFSCFIHVIFNNAVEGGLKDVEHDFLAGAKTTATRMGVSVKNGMLIIPKKFSIFSYSVKFTYIGLVILAGFQPELNLWQFDKYMIHLIMIILILIIFLTLYKFWNPPNFNRSRLIRLFAIHEIAAYFLGPVILIPLIGYKFTLILLVIPLFWFIICNIILYGKPMQPQV